MNKSRKIGISVALMLIFVLACAVIVPLYSAGNVNVAEAAAPVITDTASTWKNTYSGTYYNNLNTDKTGTAFRSDLASLITSTHKHQTTYSELGTVFKTSDADPDKSGNIIWFYTGTSTSFSGSFGSSVGSTNREHVWAKNGGDTFPAQSGPGADAHHLRPTEMQLNGYRSNFGFGIVPQTASNLQKEAGKSDYGTSPDGLCYLGTVNGARLFYPAKGYRGATARILFYMQVRWGDDNNLYFVDGASTSNGKGIGKITDLMRWHLEEPPTDQEIRRNEAVFKVQGNRNPFIDHPEYAEMIYCNGYDSNSNKLQEVVAQYGSYLDNENEKEAPTKITLSVSSLDLTIGQSSSQITVQATPSEASNRVTWSTSNSSVATVSAMGVVKAVSEGTATITATSIRDPNIKATLTVNVSRPALQSLSISPSSVSITQGAAQQLTVTASPSGADDSVTWESSNDSVATVSATGLVTAVSEGTATITAKSTVDSSKTASVTVTVRTQAQNSQAFTDSLNAIDSATTLKDRYDAIQEAINAYNQMSVSEKNTHKANGNYDKLQEAIEKYNQDIAKINGDFAEATDVAMQTMAYRVSLSLMAMVLIIVKRLFGR